jgi:hypothetical protein
VAVTLWASAFVGIRSAGHDFAPGALALGRLVIGSLALETPPALALLGGALCLAGVVVARRR